MGKALVVLILLAGVARADQVHLPVSGFDLELALEEGERFEAFYRYGWESDEDGGDRRMHVCVEGYAVSIISYYDHLHNASAMIAQVRDILEKFAAAAGVPDDTTYGPQPVVETVAYDSTPDTSGSSWEPPDLSLEPVYQTPPDDSCRGRRGADGRDRGARRPAAGTRDHRRDVGLRRAGGVRPVACQRRRARDGGLRQALRRRARRADPRRWRRRDQRRRARRDAVRRRRPRAPRSRGTGRRRSRGDVPFPHGPRLAASLTWRRAVADVNLSTVEEVHVNTTTAFVGIAF